MFMSNKIIVKEGKILKIILRKLKLIGKIYEKIIILVFQFISQKIDLLFN